MEKTRSRWFRKISLALVGVLALGTATGAGFILGQDAPPLALMAMAKMKRLQALRGELVVTTKQRQKIRGIMVSHKAEILPLAKSILEKKRALREAILADSPNDETIRKAAAALGKVIGNAGVLGADVLEEVRPVLSDKQQTKLATFRKDNDTIEDAWLKKITTIKAK